VRTQLYALFLALFIMVFGVSIVVLGHYQGVAIPLMRCDFGGGPARHVQHRPQWLNTALGSLIFSEAFDFDAYYI